VSEPPEQPDRTTLLVLPLIGIGPPLQHGRDRVTDRGKDGQDDTQHRLPSRQIR
jgi:hypothetical protein